VGGRKEKNMIFEWFKHPINSYRFFKLCRGINWVPDTFRRDSKKWEEEERDRIEI